MKEIGLYEAKTNLSALVTEVSASGSTIALTKHGKVVALLTPPSASSAPVRGMLKSPAFSIATDFDEDSAGFDELFEEDPEDRRVMLSKVAEDSADYRTNTDA